MPPVDHSPVSIPAGSYDSAALAKAFEKAAEETDHAKRGAMLAETLGTAAVKPAPVAEETKAEPVVEAVKPEPVADVEPSKKK